MPKAIAQGASTNALAKQVDNNLVPLEKELHARLNAVFVDIKGIGLGCPVAATQVEEAPGEVELGAVANRVTETGLGIPGEVLRLVDAKAADVAAGKQPQPRREEQHGLGAQQGLGNRGAELSVAGEATGRAIEAKAVVWT